MIQFIYICLYFLGCDELYKILHVVLRSGQHSYATALAQNQTLRYGLQIRNLSRFLGLIFRYGPWCKTKSCPVAYIAEPKPAQWPIAQTKFCAMAHCADQILYGIRQQNVKISQHDTRFGSKTPPLPVPFLPFPVLKLIQHSGP